MKKIAVLGLGAMGTRMAERLIRSGYSLTVYNRNPVKADSLVKLGARSARTPLDAVYGADLVLSMVTDDPASRDIWLSEKTGALYGVAPHTIVLESSTLSPQWIRDLSDEFEKRNLKFVEAPVLGSLPQIEAGKLIFLIAGPHGTDSRVSDVVAALGERALYFTEVGQAATVKLTVNAFGVTQVIAFTELLQPMFHCGLDLKRMIEVFSELPGTSVLMKGILSLVAANNHEPRFSIDLVSKDMRYMAELVESLKLSPDLINLILSRLRSAQSEGLGEKNLSAIVK